MNDQYYGQQQNNGDVVYEYHYIDEPYYPDPNNQYCQPDYYYQQPEYYYVDDQNNQQNYVYDYNGQNYYQPIDQNYNYQYNQAYYPSADMQHAKIDSGSKTNTGIKEGVNC